MNRFEFLRAQAYLLPCEHAQHLAPASEEEQEQGLCIFDGYCCFVLAGAARVVYFATGEELTPELGHEANEGFEGFEAEHDATQFTCHMTLTPSGSAEAMLVCKFDGSGAFEVEVGQLTGIIASSDQQALAPADPPDLEPLPVFFQLDFDAIGIRLYESSSTPLAGAGSISYARAKIVDLCCSLSKPHRGCVLPAVSEAASGLEDLLDEISGAAPFSEFVQAAARIGPTYQLKELLVSLGHSHVDGKSPNELLQAALSTAAAKHADTHVRLGARTEAIQSIQNEVRAEEARMRTRCRDLLIRAQDRSLNVASLVAKGRDAAEGVGDVELRAGDAEMRGAEEGGYSLLYECAEHTCRLEMQPARKQSRGLES
mmetsp:Transcript_43642/g.102428  ORF Transcript_43642/g.102428 Transcript_43642/m.102428 type:complete len:371 (+) Transcript_43642:74-1186(+)